MKEETKTKKVFRLWWAWNDEKEERWMEARAREGWHVRTFGPFFCTLEAGPPAEIAYRLDYQNASSLPPKNREEYLDIFRDAGWEHVGDYAGWFCFRHPAGDGPPPEIHTDAESRIAKYKRLMAVLGFFLAFLLFMAIGRGLEGGGMAARSPFLTGLYWTARFCQLAVAVLLGYALIRLCRRVRQLNARK